MTPGQIALVRQSFAQVLPIKEAAAALFYERLFETDPSTKAMFRGDMKERGRKLMAAIAMVVHNLDRIEPMLETIRNLARRHVRYGVEDRHYATVGSALLWTLEQGLGPAFTPETSEAWATAYGFLSRTMMEAAAEDVFEAA